MTARQTTYTYPRFCPLRQSPNPTSRNSNCGHRCAYGGHRAAACSSTDELTIDLDPENEFFLCLDHCAFAVDCNRERANIQTGPSLRVCVSAVPKRALSPAVKRYRRGCMLALSYAHARVRLPRTINPITCVGAAVFCALYT